ncbi:MAG: aldolase catalytic domain-containing protein [Lachnospiraceae bacterium]|nr:aldolase catalytic domain-containing protein [Lachnospiraceae bacterium]
MNNVHVLDCTLRDGGYCNDWKFGYYNIIKIIDGLVETNIDIIECGFLTNKVEPDPERTKFKTLEDISKVIPKNREGKYFVAMMNYGEYNIEDLPDYNGSSIDGIRVAFHKKNRYEALEICKKIKEKGYLVFIQAMVSLNYTDEEFLELITKVNELLPYSFYIVDSFGTMKRKDLTRLFYMVEHNLERDIWIGFHSHNNMQLAYSNAQNLATIQTNRDLIIDTSVFGMGRGAGNLNTELFIEFLNDNIEKKYYIKPLLRLIDEVINSFYQRNYWGYSLPNYISAAHNAHPNYASYLDEKKTLSIEDMNEIFNMMDVEKKVYFDKRYIEELYLKHMEANIIKEKHKSDLEIIFKGKKILLIGPGKSSVDEKSKIIALCKNDDIISISINYKYEFCETDYIFVSNIRRFKELDHDYLSRCIITSNIVSDEAYYQIKYRDLLNDIEAVRDNAVLMAIKFLIHFGADHVFLAGIDGYSHNVADNYGNDNMVLFTKNALLDSMNIGMSKVLSTYNKEISIEFLTTPKYVYLNNDES